jgi:hypothetical protein
MSMTINPTYFFEQGFPLENPENVLLWNKPLDKVTKMGEGIWSGDRNIWTGVRLYITFRKW